MSNPGFTARVRISSAGMTFCDKPRFVKLAKRLAPGEYEIELRKHAETRSAQQNKFYWAVVVHEVSEATGYEPMEAHEVLKLECNAKVIVNKQTGEERVVGGSTTELSVQEFADYLRRCQKWAAETLNVSLPDAEEQLA